MRKFLNILLLVLTLMSAVALGAYCVIEYFNDDLNDVNLTISRNTDKGFLDYEETYKMIIDICDTVNNKQIKNIPIDSVLNYLNANPWIKQSDVNINLKTYMDVDIEEYDPIVRVYNNSGKSVYMDADGNIFPSSDIYTPHLLIVNGVDFPANELGNIDNEVYKDTDFPATFLLITKVLDDVYAKCCVKQIFLDKKKNYIFSMNNTNIIVIFGDVNNIDEKLFKMKHFFDKMQGNPELDNYKEINLNYKNQVVCTKIKK